MAKKSDGIDTCGDCKKFATECNQQGPLNPACKAFSPHPNDPEYVT